MVSHAEAATSAASSPQKNLERVDALGAHFEAVLRDYLRRCSTEPVANLHDAMAYALGADAGGPAEQAATTEDDAGAGTAARGKRIRPVLCLLSAEALGASLAAAEPFALAIELMHNFCLVHDDIEDGDRTRRGRPAVWAHYGLAHGINVGDFLLVQSQRVLAEEGDVLSEAQRFRLMRLLAFTLERTHIGQALDISARAERTFTEEAYLRLVREKTGYYMAAPIQGGAIVGGADEATLATIGEMAGFLGPMFQIMDDIIDLTDGKGRESTGSDIREGKRSFLVAHAAARCTAQERERLFDALDKPREATTGDDVEAVRELFDKYGAIEAGRERCRELYRSSLVQLERLPRPLAAALGPVFESLASRSR